MSIKVRNEDKELEEVYKKDEVYSKAETNGFFKVKEYSANVTVPLNSTYTQELGEREEIDGYTIVGIIPKAVGYGNNWQVSFGFYSSHVQVFIQSFYGADLSADVSCNVLYIKTDLLEIL